MDAVRPRWIRRLKHSNVLCNNATNFCPRARCNGDDREGTAHSSAGSLELGGGKLKLTISLRCPCSPRCAPRRANVFSRSTLRLSTMVPLSTCVYPAEFKWPYILGHIASGNENGQYPYIVTAEAIAWTCCQICERSKVPNWSHVPFRTKSKHH